MHLLVEPFLYCHVFGLLFLDLDDSYLGFTPWIRVASLFVKLRNRHVGHRLSHGFLQLILSKGISSKSLNSRVNHLLDHSARHAIVDEVVEVVLLLSWNDTILFADGLSHNVYIVINFFMTILNELAIRKDHSVLS
jgi:hypothetical protein